MKKTAYRMFSRRGVFYAQHNSTGKQESLGTKNRQEAEKLIAAKNAAENNRLLNLALAKVYISASDPKLESRTWKDVMDHLCSRGKESTRDRRRREMAAKPLQKLHGKIVTQTTADDFFEALRAGTNYTNHALRLLHNLAISMGWLPWPLVPSKQWPKINLKRRRGVKLDELGNNKR